jgi:nucleoside-diphosphate-sugar epimerase
VEQIKARKVHLFQQASRDLMDVEDLARILVALLDVHHTNDLLVVASGQSVPVIDIFSELQQILKLDVEPQILNRGDKQQFSIRRIQQILSCTITFEPDYFASVLRKYVYFTPEP